MSALPMHPTERDRERFRDAARQHLTWCDFNRTGIDGDYKDAETRYLFKMWWSVERERQLLQNLNQSQGRKLTEWENKYAVLANEYQSTCAAANGTLERMEKAESELEAERKRLDWALNHGCVFRPRSERLFWHFVEKLGHSIERTTDPRATIDELIAGEPK